MPMCASCAFSVVHRRAWRHKGKILSHIHRPHHTFLGAGTSCDYMISSKGGLLPQSTGRLTHSCYWGSVSYVDNQSDFIFNHTISSTTSIETLNFKLAKERVTKAHGVQVLSYHADYLRFNDSNYKGPCKAASQQLT